MSLFRHRLVGVSIAVVLGLSSLGAIAHSAQAADPTDQISIDANTTTWRLLAGYVEVDNSQTLTVTNTGSTTIASFQCEVPATSQLWGKVFPGWPNTELKPAQTAPVTVTPLRGLPAGTDLTGDISCSTSGGGADTISIHLLVVDQPSIGDLTLDGATGVGQPDPATGAYGSSIVQVGQELTVSVAQDDIIPANAPVTVNWFCGTTSLGTATALIDEYSSDPSASYVVQPKDVGCALTATASVTAAGQTVSSASSSVITVPALALDGGDKYPDYAQEPSWVLLKGYDAAAQTLGTYVVTNWGSAAVTGLACSVTADPDSSSIASTIIVKQPDANVAAQAATTVQLAPIAGLPVGSYSSQLSCQDSTGTALSTNDVSVDVIDTPELDLYVSSGQIGDTLEAIGLTVPDGTDVTGYRWVCLGAAGVVSAAPNNQGTSSYGLTPADAGCNLAVQGTISLAGYDAVTSQSDPVLIAPVTFAGSTAWKTTLGYDLLAVAPVTQEVVLTNQGSQPVTDLEFSPSASGIVLPFAAPAVSDLAPGASTTVLIGFPSTPLGAGDHVLSLNLSYTVGDTDYTDVIYSEISVDDGIAPIAYIQPSDGTATTRRDVTPAPGGSTPEPGTSTPAVSSSGSNGTVSVSTGGSVVSGTGSTWSGAAASVGAVALLALGGFLLRRRTR